MMMQNRPLYKRTKEAGNAIAMVFMAIGMAGVVTYGLNNIIRGPAVTAAETSRRTIVENNLIATTRLAIAASARQQANGGDCDQDGFVEPLPFRTPGGAPAPTNGGLLPMTLGASMSDAWGTQYGYCVWDQGTVRKSDAFAGCGGAGANRLEGAPRDDQPAIAVISAGKNGTFQTTCNNYVDTTPADGKPDTSLVVEAVGSDDVVLSYTYAEANGIGGGLWKISQDVMKPDTAEISKNIRSTSTGGASFGDAVELKNRGLVLPGDDGTDTTTGPCDSEVKDGQLRRNTSTSPPTLEMCDFTNGAGWIAVTGGTAGAASWAFNPNIGNCTANQGGPLAEITRFNLPNATSIWSGAGRPTQLLYTTSSGDDRVYALTFDGATFQQTWAATGLNLDYSGVWGDGSYVYTISDDALKAWQWNGTELTELDSITLNGIDVWAADGKVFVTSAADPITAYTFNGTAFTAAGSVPAKSAALHLWGKDSNIFVADVGGSMALSHSGSTLTEVATALQDMTVTGDANYIYIGGPNGIKAYTFSGSALTEVGDLNYPDLARQDLWTDGVNIFALEEATLTVLTFDGTTFSVVDQIVLSGAGPHYMGTIWGDGNYIYVAGTSGLYALSGYGCTSPNPPGGPGVATITGTPSSVLPDSLDAGLISHWKMDEGSGNGILDALGANYGTLVANSTRTKGQVGGGVSISTYDAGGGITIPGLMGGLQEGTIAGWVNITTDRDVSIFSVGDYAILGYSVADGLFFKFWDNSTYRFTNSNRLIGGDGWHYVAATFDAPNDMFRVYVDGIMASEQAYTQNISWGAAPNTLIGKKGPTSLLENMTGSVDDFRFYNRALSSAEIAELSKRSQAEASSGNLAQTASAAKTGGMVSPGENFTCAIGQDGGALCWGRDNTEQLGNGVGATQQNLPVQVIEPTEQVYNLYNVPANINYAGTPAASWLPWVSTTINPNGPWNAGETFYGHAIAPPGHPGPMSGAKPYTLVLSQAAPQPCIQLTLNLSRLNASGAVQTTGQLGQPILLNGTSGEVKGLVDLGTFSATDRLAIRAQWTNTCGSPVPIYNFSSQLKIPRISYPAWASLSSGTFHTCGVKTDATAWCWGRDNVGQLGNSSFSSANMAEPTPVTGTLNATWNSIDSGMNHVCGIGLNGALYCWGDDTEGQLGNGATSGIQHEPVRVGTDSDWASVSAASTGLHTCAIKNNGRMWCWGRDNRGQLGNGAASSTSQLSPVEISDPGPWVRVTAGTEHTCGIKTDGSAWCWGDNALRQIDASGTNRDDPVLIRGEGAWIDVAAGFNNTCGLKSDSRVYCWGSGANGDLGNGGTANIFPPRPVNGLDNVASIAGGRNHNCAVRTNGSVFCWGINTEGQMGIGSVSAMQTTPVQARGMPGAPNWWNYADASNIIMAPYGFNSALLGGMFHNAGTESFGFTSPGRAVLSRLNGTDNSQLLIESNVAGSSVQSTFNASSPASTTDVTTGLVGRWPLDTNSNASVGASVNGTDNNGVVYSTKGRIGGTGAYSGVNSFTDVPRSVAVMEHAQTITVSAWVKRTGQQKLSTSILRKTYDDSATAPGYSWGFDFTSGHKIAFLTGHTTDAQSVTESTTALPDGAWTHIVGIFNNTGGAPQKRLYINGVLNSTSTMAPNIKYFTSNPARSKLYIGAPCPYCARHAFKGAIDDLRVYNRALSDAEVLQLFNYGAIQGQIPYSMGIDHATNNLEIGRNVAGGGNMLNAITPDFGITSTGNVGLGVAAPVTKLDVNGGVRLGIETACDTSRAGTMRYTGAFPPYEFCNGTAWQSFGIGNMTTAWKKDWGRITGGTFACSIKSDGSAWCWGNGDRGYAGNGTTTGNNTRPVRVLANAGSSHWTDWRSIAAGAEHTCAIRSNGSAWCWGWGTTGRLGNGGTADQSRPVQVLPDSGPLPWFDWVHVASGYAHSCGIRSDGSAWCWGSGNDGELGHGAFTDASRPVRVQTNTGPGGWNDWVQLSIGVDFSCGIRSDGSAWCWGEAGNGRLGNGVTSGTNSRPVRVQTDTGPGGWSDWVQISAREFAVCGIRSDGSAWCWGIGANGRIGDGGTSDRSRPVRVQTNTGPGGWSDWVKITTHYDASCGIRTDGSAWCWGTAGFGKLGNGTTSGDQTRPVRVQTNTGPGGWNDWTDISSGGDNHCGIRTNGQTWCWGHNGNGQLGNGNTTGQSRPVQVVD